MNEKNNLTGHVRIWLLNRFNRPWQMIVGAIALLGLAIALFLLLRPSSDVQTLGLPPWALLQWIDRHGEFRNTPAFAILAIPFLLLARGRKERRAVVVTLATFVELTEFGQLFIRTRFFDPADILLGWSGLGITWALMEVGILFRRHQPWQAASRRLIRTPISTGLP